MTFEPFPSQIDDLEQLRANNYTGLIVAEPGYGKSVTALMAIKDSGAEQTLIIAPQSTHLTAWDKDARLVLGHGVRIVGKSNKAQKAALQDLEWGVPGLFIVTPQLFTRTDISMWAPDYCVVDEGHILSTPGKAGQRKLSGYSVKDNPISQRAKMRLFLSGTPFRNKFENSWGVMRFLWPELYRRNEVAYDNYYGFLNARMTSEDVFAGRKPEGGIRTVKKWLVESNPGQLLEEAPCVIRHFRRSACCKHHSPNGFLKMEEANVVERTVELTAEQKRIIKDFENQGLAWIQDHPYSVDLPITLQQRIRQTCLAVPSLSFTGELDEYGVEKVVFEYQADNQSSFADEVENILEQIGDETAVIYLESQKFAKALTERLKANGVSAFEFSGATTKTRMKDFQEWGTKYRVCVAVVSAFSTGTDGAQRVCRNEIWLQVPVDDVLSIQGEARLERTGGTQQVQRFRVYDDFGYARGMYDQKLTERMGLQRSLM